MSWGVRGRRKRKLQKERKKGKKSDVLSMLSAKGMLMIYGLYCPLAISAGLFWQRKKTALNNLSPFPFFLLLGASHARSQKYCMSYAPTYIYNTGARTMLRKFRKDIENFLYTHTHTYILLPPPVSDSTGFHACGYQRQERDTPLYTYMYI